MFSREIHEETEVFSTTAFSILKTRKKFISQTVV